MKKMNMIRHSLMAATALVLMASCNKTQPEATGNASGTQIASPSADGLKIAYVEVDSLMSQYNFCKDYAAVLEKKSNNIRATLSSRGKSLQQQAAQFQSKLQSNGFTSQEQAERVQAGLVKQQQDLQTLEERLSNEFAMEQQKYNEEMRDSIQSFLKEYNKTKKYDYILSKAGDNLLLANPKYDITNDVVAGLNKRYKASPTTKTDTEAKKGTETKKDEVKK